MDEIKELDSTVQKPPKIINIKLLMAVVIICIVLLAILSYSLYNFIHVNDSEEMKHLKPIIIDYDLNRDKNEIDSNIIINPSNLQSDANTNIEDFNSEDNHLTDSNTNDSNSDDSDEIITDDNEEPGDADFSGVLYESKDYISNLGIYDNTIVWLEKNNIYYMDIIVKQPIMITTDGVKTYIKISGPNIVYTNYDQDCIFLYNIQEDSVSEIGEGQFDCQNPFIYSNKIVWTSYVGGVEEGGYVSGGLWHIFVYDIDSMQIIKDIETAIEPLSWAPGPIMYNSKILWKDRISNKWGLYVFDLDTDEKKQILPDKSSFLGSPDMYNNKILYNTGDYILYLYDLESESEIQVTTGDAHPIDRPVLNEKYISWCDARSNFNNHDIYVFSLSELSEHFSDKDEDYYEKDPQLYENKLVYLKNPVSGLGNYKIIINKLD